MSPEHEDRRETAEFRRSKGLLKREGHFYCFVCESDEDLQVHHIAEWFFAENIDFTKLKNLLKLFDPYGYSRALRHKPLTTVDDVRNCLVLCQKHHTGKETGIHFTTWPTWILQAVAKDGESPIPKGLAFRPKLPWFKKLNERLFQSRKGRNYGQN